MCLRNNQKANYIANSSKTRKHKTSTQKQTQDKAACMRIIWRQIFALVRSLQPLCNEEKYTHIRIEY